MKVSARNAFPGKILEIKKGATTAHVVLDVQGLKVTASITNEAVDDLNLKVGDEATAIVKASDVLVAVK
ncbi:TOBE domain-containing protein [Xanthobacter sp. TB0136]|uniref:TOBE domain-containing protein n=1 Tax=Xanthobacter sp. TB0136 TaxID=3459177 RepID=UPI00403A1FEA